MSTCITFEEQEPLRGIILTPPPFHSEAKQRKYLQGVSLAAHNFQYRARTFARYIRYSGIIPREDPWALKICFLRLQL